VTTGPKVKAFEEAFAKYVGANHVVAVHYGTAALHLALDPVRIKEGDEIIVLTMTFAARADVVHSLKATPTGLTKRARKNQSGHPGRLRRHAV